MTCQFISMKGSRIIICISVYSALDISSRFAFTTNLQCFDVRYMTPTQIYFLFGEDVEGGGGHLESKKYIYKLGTKRMSFFIIKYLLSPYLIWNYRKQNAVEYLITFLFINVSHRVFLLALSLIEYENKNTGLTLEGIR